MKRKLILCTSILILAALTQTVFGQKPTRIRFARGKTHANVSGTLRSYKDKKVFVIRVKTGQTLSTTQMGDSHPITIYVDDPAGEEAGDSDASCNNRREIQPTKAGDYHIRVVECRKADNWRGFFKFRLTVR